ARREFLHVDDLASACLFLLEHYGGESHINVGTGVDLSIRELAEAIRSLVNPDAEIVWDATKPDGTPRKLLDVSRLRALGWEPSIELDEGLAGTYGWFLEQLRHDRAVRGVDTPAAAAGS
ncbi:MAG: NAD-dependent epimerase/dehydratase family protein, partial [Ilumatobacter sp.]|nr:NAD-dependent epimerase/dehydratase family protein [Ilumatobacter sp.]